MKMKALTLTAGIFGIGCCLLSSCGGKSASAGAASAHAPEIAVITVEPTDAEFQSSYPATIKGKTDFPSNPQAIVEAVLKYEKGECHPTLPLIHDKINEFISFINL